MKPTPKISSIIAVLLVVCILGTMLAACNKNKNLSEDIEPEGQTELKAELTGQSTSTSGVFSVDDYADIIELNNLDYVELGKADYVFVGKVIRNDVLNYDPFTPTEEQSDENGDPISTYPYVFCTVQVVENLKGSLVTDTDVELQAKMDRNTLEKDDLPVVGEDYIFCTYANNLDGSLYLPDDYINIPASENWKAKMENGIVIREESGIPLVSIYDEEILSKLPEGSDLNDYVFMENLYNAEVYNSDYVFVGKVTEDNGIKKIPLVSDGEVVRDIAAVSYSIEVIKNIKSSLVTDRDIELLKECGISESGELLELAEWDFYPEVGETYIFCAHTKQDTEGHELFSSVYMSTFPYSEDVLAKIESVYESQGENELRFPMSIYDTAYEG